MLQRVLETLLWKVHWRVCLHLYDGSWARQIARGRGLNARVLVGPRKLTGSLSTEGLPWSRPIERGEMWWPQLGEVTA
jgi:hypothetical protein